MTEAGHRLALAAPDPEDGKHDRTIAIIVGIVLSVGLVFVAPLFR